MTDGEPHRHGTDEDGAALTIARRRKERTYPELTGGSGRAKLVVIAGETGGRFSEETQTFLRLLEGARTRSFRRCCALAPASLGCTDGPSHARCLVCMAIWAQTATRLLCRTCSATSAGLPSLIEGGLVARSV